MNNIYPGSIAVPLGIATIICLCVTLTLGFLMPRNRKTLFPLHKRMALTTLIMAVIHGLIVLFFY